MWRGGGGGGGGGGVTYRNECVCGGRGEGEERERERGSRREGERIGEGEERGRRGGGEGEERGRRGGGEGEERERRGGGDGEGGYLLSPLQRRCKVVRPTEVENLIVELGDIIATLGEIEDLLGWRVGRAQTPDYPWSCTGLHVLYTCVSERPLIPGFNMGHTSYSNEQSTCLTLSRHSDRTLYF